MSSYGFVFWSRCLCIFLWLCFEVGGRGMACLLRVCRVSSYGFDFGGRSLRVLLWLCFEGGVGRSIVCLPMALSFGV